MGTCVPQHHTQNSRIKKSKNETYSKMSLSQQQPQSQLKEIKWRIVDKPNQKKMIFNHSSLKSNDYLNNKFHHDQNRPDQLNLEWQIKSAQLHGNTIKLGVINRVKVRLWVVIGGQIKRNITGLYLSIDQYFYSQVINLEQLSNKNQVIYYEMIIDNRIPANKQIRIIFESVSDPNQSLYLANTYKVASQKAGLKLQRQQLMWSSLAFQLQNIYNQSQQIVNAQEQEEQSPHCVICHEQLPSCILVPCRHMCIGKRCITNFKKMYKFCPLCKKDFQQIIIYREIRQQNR